MKQENPGPAFAGSEAGISKLDSTNMRPFPQNFNRPTGPRLLREIMTPAWWRSVLPEDVANDLHFARQVERAFKHGPVPFFYMLREIGRRRSVMTHIEAVVDRFAELDPEVVKAMGADRFPSYLVPISGGRK